MYARSRPVASAECEDCDWAHQKSQASEFFVQRPLYVYESTETGGASRRGTP